MSDATTVSESLYDKLRRMITELREFAGLERQEIAERTGCNPTTIGRFQAGVQETIPYAKGLAIEALYAEHEEMIRARKKAKSDAILASLGAST